jgi:ribonucleoside-diphosphate reductase alpha chain
VADLQSRNLWTEEVRSAIKKAEGSIQGVEAIPAEMKELYRTAWELPMKSLIDMAADRGAYIDQSQSLNLFMESPSIGKVSSMYMYAWEKGIKTTYYLRSRPATRIRQTDGGVAQVVEPEKQYTDEEALTCSLENPESCDSCQ